MAAIKRYTLSLNIQYVATKRRQQLRLNLLLRTTSKQICLSEHTTKGWQFVVMLSSWLH